MKTRTLISILTFILFVVIVIGGCATTSIITEPTNAESTLLVGRIILTCTDFPRNWHVNGEHSTGITVAIRNMSTNKIISARSRGYDGMFYIINPDVGKYKIEQFTSETGGDLYRVTLMYAPPENTFFIVKKNTVNNLGDIEWYEKAEIEASKEHLGTKSQTRLFTTESHNFKRNYAELKSWFAETYPDSAWNDMNWNSLEFTSK